MSSSRRLAAGVLYAENTSDMSVNNTTRLALPGLALTLAANCVYDIQVFVPFTSVIASNTIRIATLDWPDGMTGQFEATVWNTVTSGTAPKSHQLWTDSARSVTGLSGSASVVGSTMAASVSARVKMGPSPGVLAMAIAAFTNTGAVTVAANTASMTATKISSPA